MLCRAGKLGGKQIRSISLGAECAIRQGDARQRRPAGSDIIISQPQRQPIVDLTLPARNARPTDSSWPTSSRSPRASPSWTSLACFQHALPSRSIAWRRKKSLMCWRPRRPLHGRAKGSSHLESYTPGLWRYIPVLVHWQPCTAMYAC
jgi:hypothetical protein